MPRRWRTGLVLVAAVVAFAAGCSGSSEQKLLGDFFRASRLRDDLTLGNFATATFDPRTDGAVEVRRHQRERREVTPPLKQFVKDIEDAKAADADATTKRREFYNANAVAVARFANSRPRTSRFRRRTELKSSWDCGSGRQRKLSSRTRSGVERRAWHGRAEPAAERRTVDASPTELATKEVLMAASVRPAEQPAGDEEPRPS
jgi:hypothetical protein